MKILQNTKLLSQKPLLLAAASIENHNEPTFPVMCEVFGAI